MTSRQSPEEFCLLNGIAENHKSRHIIKTVLMKTTKYLMLILLTGIIIFGCKKPPQDVVLTIDKTTMKPGEKATLKVEIEGKWIWISSFETDSTGSNFKSSGGGKSDTFYFDGAYEPKKTGTYKFYVEVFNCQLKGSDTDGQPDCKSKRSNEVSLTVTL